MALAGAAISLPGHENSSAPKTKPMDREELEELSLAPNFPYNIIEKINPDASDALFQIVGTEIENRMLVNRILKKEGVNSVSNLDPNARKALLDDLCHYRAVSDCLPLILGLGYLSRGISAVVNPLILPDTDNERIKQGITSANTFTVQSALLITYFPGLLTKVRDAYVEEMIANPELGNNPNKIPLKQRMRICWNNFQTLKQELKTQTINLAKLPFQSIYKLGTGNINAYIDLMFNLAGYLVSINNISDARFVLNASRSAGINRTLLANYSGNEEGRRRLSSNSGSNSVAWTLLFGVSGMAQPLAAAMGLCPKGSTAKGTINIKQFMGDFVRTIAQLTGKKEAVLLLRKWFDQNLANEETKSFLWHYLEPELNALNAA